MIQIVEETPFQIVFEIETNVDWILSIQTHIHANGSTRDKLYLNSEKFGHHGQSVHMNFSTRQRLQTVQFDNQPFKVIKR
jgi:hypothetical protein